MRKKPSNREWGQNVTKGFLHEQDFVTKNFMFRQDYVTKDYLDKRFVKFRKEINQDFQFYIDSVMEDNRETTRMLIEAFENRFQIIEKKLFSI